MKKLLFGLLSAAWAFSASAQLDNHTFINRLPMDSSRTGRLYADVQTMGFTKNNEYFNKIADGYTLFGFQVHPSLTYYAHDKLRVDFGVFARKDYGAGGFQELVPTFSVKMQQKNWQFIFGNLEGSLNHGLVEPLYNFELVMTDRLENGLQALLQKDRVFFDAWVNWETMLYPGDSSQEEVSGGIVFRYDIIQKERFRLSFPFQFKAYHQGGQIDISEAPLTTFWNHATGLEAEWVINPNGFLKSIITQNYWVAFKDFSFTYQFPFQKGYGTYLNLGIKTKHFDLMASYWDGHDYLSYKGGLLYFSESQHHNSTGYTEPHRQLLIIRFIQNIQFTPALGVSLRVEPHYDILNSKFEFSHGAYFSYRTDFRLSKNKIKKW